MKVKKQGTAAYSSLPNFSTVYPIPHATPLVYSASKTSSGLFTFNCILAAINCSYL